MDEPIEPGKSTAARYEWATSVFKCKPIPPGTPRALAMTMGNSTTGEYEWATSVFKCKPIPPGTPRALGMSMGLPDEIDSPPGATPAAPPGAPDTRDQA